MVQSEIMPNKKQKIDKSKKETTSQIDDKSKRIKKRKNKFKKPSDFTAKLPQNSEDFSCNWKKLMTTIEKDPKKANDNIKKRPSPKKDIQISVLEKVQKESKKPTIWFDDVDTELLDPEDRPNFVGEMKDDQAKKEGLVKEKSFKGLTKILAMDCEMVGVGYGGKDSILARASIVNHFGNCVYDKYVKPTEKVTDYRTKVSGIRPEDIKNGEEFKTVQKEISDMLTGRVLIGHSIKHDLKVLFLDHPKKNIRDTSMYKPFRSAFGGKTPSLKNLTSRMLGVAVQVSIIFQSVSILLPIIWYLCTKYFYS